MSPDSGASPLAQADRWHFSFAGLLLLLFGLFVLLFAISQKRVANLTAEVKILEEKVLAERSRPHGAVSRPPSESKAETEDAVAITANEILQTVILREVGDRKNLIETEAGPGGSLLLRVIAPDLYQAGEYRVSESQRPLLNQLGEAIRDSGRRIRIGADADPEDEENLQRLPKTDITQTWDLSAMRAAWVANTWVDQFNFDPSRMEVQAHGRYRGGKRRLEVIIEKMEP